MADVLRRPVVVSNEKENTSRGSSKTWCHVSAKSGRAAMHQKGWERQHGIYDAIIGHKAEIAQWLTDVQEKVDYTQPES